MDAAIKLADSNKGRLPCSAVIRKRVVVSWVKLMDLEEENILEIRIDVIHVREESIALVKINYVISPETALI